MGRSIMISNATNPLKESRKESVLRCAIDLSARKGTKSSGLPYGNSLTCAPNMNVCPASWAWRTEHRFLWLSGMTRAADGSTR